MPTEATEFSKRKKPIDMATMIYGKMLPHASDLERAILGLLMLESSIEMGSHSMSIVAKILKVEDFYSEAHQLIYNAICNIDADNAAPTTLLVVERLKVNNDLETVGGPIYVTRCTNEVTSSTNIESHCRIVKQYSTARKLIAFAGSVIKDSYENEDVFKILDNLGQFISDINEAIEITKTISHDHIALDHAYNFLQKVEMARADPNYTDPDSVLTGMGAWDNINGS